MLYVLSYQHRSCDNTPENCFFQMSSYSRADVRIMFLRNDIKGQVPLGTLLGKQNIQAKEVCWTIPRSTRKYKMSQLIINFLKKVFQLNVITIKEPFYQQVRDVSYQERHKNSSLEQPTNKFVG